MIAMRLAELSRRSGMSSPTIKYYLRLGLLHPGVAESSTWSSYDQTHVRRLALVRALTDVGRLSLEEVRRVLAAVDDSGPRHETLGTVQWALAGDVDLEPTAGSLARVDALLERHGWALAPENPYRLELAAALDRLDALDHEAGDELLDRYAHTMREIAEHEVGTLPEDAVLAAERVVTGTVLLEPVLLALRRMAHEVASARR